MTNAFTFSFNFSLLSKKLSMTNFSLLDSKGEQRWLQQEEDLTGIQNKSQFKSVSNTNQLEGLDEEFISF